jgi:ectoine hydroxylase-related dioxygenase (phytanoyl-CoA dioxygenase family)
MVVRAAIPRARVRELERAVDELYAAQSSARGGVWEMVSPSRVARTIAEHMHDEAIGETCAEALGCASVQLLQDTLLVKAPGDGGLVPWHQDFTYMGYLDRPRAVSVRLALSECKLENGCLEVIGGSHAWGAMGALRPWPETRIVDVLGSAAERWRDQIVAIELMPGDLSIHHCLTLHRSRENRSGEPRKTLVTRLFDGACTLVKERLPEDAAPYFPVDEQGHFASAAFPVVYPALRRPEPP